MNKKSLFSKYALYLVRWQLSTPILAIVLIVLGGMNEWIATIIANFIGGLMFFWIDKWIFAKKQNKTLFELCENTQCSICNKTKNCLKLIETTSKAYKKHLNNCFCKNCYKNHRFD